MPYANPYLSRRQPAYTMTHEEEQSLIRSLSSGAMSGLGYVGETLDKPGAAVRGMLSGLTGGDWGGGLLNLVPFSDAMGLTNSNERVSGRDLLEDVGFLGDNETGLDPGDVLGFAAEVGLDPLTYLTLGGSAVGKAGKLARAAGVYDDAARLGLKAGGASEGLGKRLSGMTTGLGDIGRAGGDDAMRSILESAQGMGYGTGPTAKLGGIMEDPLRGAFGVGLPFGESMVPKMAQSPLAQKVAGYADTVGEAARWSPVGRGAHMMMNSKVAGMISKTDQILATDVNRRIGNTKPEAMMTAIDAHKSRRSLMNDYLAETGKKLDEDGARAFDQEMQYFMDNREAMPGSKISEEIRDGMTKQAIKMSDVNKEVYDELIDWGGTGKYLEGGEDFYQNPRYADTADQAAKTTGGDLLKPVSGSQRHREPSIALMGVDKVHEIMADPKAWKTVRTKGAPRPPKDENGADWIFDNHNKKLNDEYVNSAGEEIGKEGHAKELANWISKHGKDKEAYLNGDKQIFPFQPMENHQRYQVGIAHATATVKSIQKMIHDHIKNPIKGIGDEVGTVKVEDVFSNAGMEAGQANIKLADSLGMPVEDLNGMLIPKDIADAAQNVGKYFTDPKWRTEIGLALDSMTDLFKRAVTLPFPAFSVRNLTSGQWMNMVSGILKNPADIKNYVKAGANVHSMKQLSKIKDKDLLRFLDEAEAYGVIDNKHLFEGVSADDLISQEGILPGRFRDTFNPVKTFGEQAEISDLAPRGLKTATQVGKTFTGTGAKWSQQAEWMNRMTPYVYLRRKGFTAKAAADKVAHLQHDYGKLSPWEKSTAKRVIPFWTFTKKQAGLTYDVLSESPGGALAQTIRATTGGHDPDISVPDYIASGSAIPLGELEDGSLRYITGLGLAHESPLNMLGGPDHMIKQAAKQLSPYLQLPIEAATGQSIFKEQPLEDVDPMIGRLFSNLQSTITREDATGPVSAPFGRGAELWASKTPASRGINTISQLLDIRKQREPLGFSGLLSGVKVSDVSPASIDKVTRTRASDAMSDIEGSKSFTNFYLPEYAQEDMSPAELANAHKIMALQRLLGQTAKDRAAERKAGTGRL